MFLGISYNRLTILFCAAMLALDSTKSSSSSNENGARTQMEKFAERLIKEENGLDLDVRLKKNNGRYEFKVRYK